MSGAKYFPLTYGGGLANLAQILEVAGFDGPYMDRYLIYFQ